MSASGFLRNCRALQELNRRAQRLEGTLSQINLCKALFCRKALVTKLPLLAEAV